MIKATRNADGTISFTGTGYEMNQLACAAMAEKLVQLSRPNVSNDFKTNMTNSYEDFRKLAGDCYNLPMP